MRTEKKFRSLATFASLGMASLMNGQSGGRAMMRNDEIGPVEHEAPRTPADLRPAPGTTPTVVHISDDGRNDDYAPTEQFIISVERAVAGTVSVDVLSEQGELLRLQSFTTKVGRNLITVEVQRFPKGRYALRVLSEANASVVRFRRD